MGDDKRTGFQLRSPNYSDLTLFPGSFPPSRDSLTEDGNVAYDEGTRDIHTLPLFPHIPTNLTGEQRKISYD